MSSSPSLANQPDAPKHQIGQVNESALTPFTGSQATTGSQLSTQGGQLNTSVTQFAGKDSWTLPVLDPKHQKRHVCPLFPSKCLAEASPVGSSGQLLKVKDKKLSEFLQKNPEFFPPPPQKCTFKIRLFYIYTLIIIGVTIFFVVDPKMATKTAKDMVYLIKLTNNCSEPWRFLLFSGLIHLHQLFGVPLQTVTVALICFATKQFLYGYIVVCTTCVWCSSLTFFLVRRPMKAYIERNFRDNSFVQVIRAEASLAPVKVSFLFRFMYLPGMYKNLGLSLSTINFATFILPAVIEICLSNTINCMVGVMLREGFTSVGVDSSSSHGAEAKRKRVVILFGYIMSGLQVICIVIAVLVTMMKMKKIRYLQKLLQIEADRRTKEQAGYIFDFEAQKPASPLEMEKKSESIVSPEKTPILQPIEEHQVQVFKSLFADQSVVSISQESPRVPDHEARKLHARQVEPKDSQAI